MKIFKLILSIVAMIVIFSCAGGILTFVVSSFPVFMSVVVTMAVIAVVLMCTNLLKKIE